MHEQPQADRSGDAQLRELTNDVLPPVCIDPHGSATASRFRSRTRTGRSMRGCFRTWSRRSLFNAINWSFGARWSDGDTVYGDTNPPDNAAGGSDSIPQMTVLVTTIAVFLCPSDSQSRLLRHLPRGWREQAGGCQQLSVQYRPEPADQRRGAGSELEAERSQLRGQQLG